jgi:hypothetical protein
MNRAIAYFKNGLGNLIEMFPAFQAVASMTDNKKIDVVIDSQWSDSRRPAVELLCKKWETFGQMILYPNQGFDPRNYKFWFFSPHGSNDCDAVHVFKSRMNYRPVPRPNWRQSGINEKEHYMEIARAMGYSGDVPNVNFPLADGPILNLKRPIIGLCNGFFRTSTHYWDSKGWPHFSQFSILSKEFFMGSTIGVGLKDELPSDVQMDIDFTGKLNILETAKVLSQVDLFITTDTGLMHMGDLLRIPMICLFGSTLTTKNAPWSKNAHILQVGRECAPCQDTARFLRCKERKCMELISAGDAMAKAREVLGEYSRNCS